MDEAAPPGVPLHRLSAEDQRLVLVGLDGLAARLRREADIRRAGTRGYHDLHSFLGRVSVIAAVLRRHLAACEASEGSSDGEAVG